MLKTLACPSYVKTQQETEQNMLVDCAVMPYDQFHSFMTETHSNNMQILEVNMIVSDLVKVSKLPAENQGKAFAKILNRAKKYLNDK